MPTVITRSFASTPKRTANETWSAIISVLAPDQDSEAHKELSTVAGVAASAIASEAPLNDAFIVFGNGPQVRIYCVFGEDAVTGDGVDEDSFHQAPAAGDWAMSIPCHEEDLDWTQKKLKTLSSRVTARALGEKLQPSNENERRASTSLALDLDEFLKP